MSSDLLHYEQAAALVAGYAAELGGTPLATERVELGLAAGRVLAQPLCADRDQPPFPRSSRDGFACRAAEASAHGPLTIAGATRAGEASGGPLPPGAAWEIMTGAPVPEGTDAVVMIEHVETTHDTEGGTQIAVPAPRTLVQGENIVARAAEARAGEELVTAGTRIGPAQIALAAACGYAAVEVFVRPRVAIVTTGDELVAIDSVPAGGQIRNSNAPMLAALAAAAGAEPWVLPTAVDNAGALDVVLAVAMEADLLLLSGGVSAGKFDLVEEALARAGARFHFTGVRLQPGKPVVFGDVPQEGRARILPFFGLPGNPVSSAVTFLLFAAPVIGALTGSRNTAPRFVLARLAADWRGKSGLTRFLPAFCTFKAGLDKAGPEQPPEVTAVPMQGSGDLAAFVRSNCFLVVPEQAGQLDAGTLVRILLPN